MQAGGLMVTEFTTYTQYTPTELQDLGKQCRQRAGELLVVSLVAVPLGQGSRQHLMLP